MVAAMASTRNWSFASLRLWPLSGGRQERPPWRSPSDHEACLAPKEHIVLDVEDFRAGLHGSDGAYDRLPEAKIGGTATNETGSRRRGQILRLNFKDKI